ncbi:hypothetical protein MUB18_14565 [Sphingobacterium sp. PCS056]|uniref:hypothetical protein n=1 Tax=Sphingobacterium TaxID=28453 RepID=UPI00200BFF21|nr:hypothetical protein [Sphingobacterium sp. PCS056]UPZ35330.1 hypothetical protein MUB18_14565 [Sphingobacterium sp. PCS056]
MNLHAETADKRLGLIVAAMMVNPDQSDNQDPNRSSHNDTDEDDDSTLTHPDPELEDPNAKPERHQEHQESDLEEYSRDETHGRDRDDLIDPIDPLN